MTQEKKNLTGTGGNTGFDIYANLQNPAMRKPPGLDLCHTFNGKLNHMYQISLIGARIPSRRINTCP